MKVLLIEDEIPAAKRLANLITELEPEWEILDSIDEIEQAIKLLNNHPQPDLIFMDIQLADGFSFEIFKAVEVKAPVIFVTAFDQYAVNAFRVNGLDYILKPVALDVLKESIDRFKSMNSQTGINIEALKHLFKQEPTHFKERFLIKSGEELNFVRTSEIAYFLSEASYSFIVTKSQNRYIVDLTLDQIEAELNPSLFFRINRKQIVCLDCIVKISNYFNNRLKLDLSPAENSETVVSRTRIKAFKEWLNQ